VLCATGDRNHHSIEPLVIQATDGKFLQMLRKESCSARAPHVLVVEDEVLIRMSTVAALEDLGCTTVQAGCAAEALTIIRDNTGIAVLFTDINMPGVVDGLELARMVRKRWPDINVVICSGQLLPPKSSLPEGVRFVAKPYYHDELVQIAHASGC
jgi:two-component system, response regulator PdtaR